jgi:hypothetical protein
LISIEISPQKRRRYNQEARNLKLRFTAKGRE